MTSVDISNTQVIKHLVTHMCFTFTVLTSGAISTQPLARLRLFSRHSDCRKTAFPFRRAPTWRQPAGAAPVLSRFFVMPTALSMATPRFRRSKQSATSNLTRIWSGLANNSKQSAARLRTFSSPHTNSQRQLSDSSAIKETI